VAAIGIVFGYKGMRMNWRAVWDALVQTGISSLDILMIAAAAGFITGILQATGLSFALTLLLVKLGGGNLVLLLIIAALLCIVLGMGMPTIGVYVLLAVLVAPSLVELGFSKLAAHMFILYLGMMSMVTPPIAIAGYFAASLAKAEPMKTCFIAMRFGWTAYIVPFLFMFSPALLILESPSATETIIACMTAIAGVWIVSIGMVGYLFRPLNGWLRTAFLVAGSGLLLPDQIAWWAAGTDLAGGTLGLVLIGNELLQRRRSAAAVG
jgi:TRAP-type uncharacterized transport system fused permease subunit